MTITRIPTDNNNEKAILDFLNINYPGYKFLNEGEYRFYRNGKPYSGDVEVFEKGKKTVRIDFKGDDGLSLELPIELLRVPKTSVVPVYLNEDDCFHLNIFTEAQKAKPSYASEKVISYKNFEIRNGNIIPRNHKLLDAENIFIIEA